MKIVRITAKWCGPCKTYAPIFDKWAKENPDIETQVVDMDSNPDFAADYGIKSIPTTLFLKDDGTVIERAVGAQSYDQVQAVVDSIPDE